MMIETIKIIPTMSIIPDSPSLNDPQCSYETTYQSDDEGVHSPSDYSHQLREPSELNLFHRHRAPPSSVSGADSGAVMLIRRQIERICEDSTAQVRHAVPALSGVGEEKTPDIGIDISSDDGDGADAIHKKRDPTPVNRKAMWRSMVHRRKLSALQYLHDLKPFRALTLTEGASTGSYTSSFYCLRGYTLGAFGRDAAAGCTVAIMGIPLGMSYAKLAGLPAYYGLYASFVPPLVYSFVGTSKQLQVGPAALVSLMVSAGVSAIVTDEGLSMDSDPDRYVERYSQLSIQCAFLVGIINLLMGLLKLGFVAQFLSKALISGFTSGAAIIICLSQLKNLFGYSTPPSTEAHQIIRDLIEGISQFNWKTFLMGSCSIAFLITTKYISTNEWITEKLSGAKWLKALGPMIVSAVGIIVVYSLNLTEVIPCVGHIPPGLPIVTVSWWTPVSPSLFRAVIPMVIVGFVNSFAVGKRISYQRGYDLDSSMEFLSLGLSNLIGSVFQSFPVTGTIAQSFVNDDIGAQTGVASIITGILTMMVLLFLTKVFELLPLSILAAIVISFVSGMFDYHEAIYLYKVHFFDFVVWMVALLGTVFLGVVTGLAISVGFSLLLIIYESAYPHTAQLGRLHGTSLYHNIKQYQDVESYDGVIIIRVDAPLYFANAQNVRDKVRKYKKRANEELKERKTGIVIRYIIIDLAPVSYIDATALQVLQDMYNIQKASEVQMCFCNPGIRVTERFLKAGFIELVGREHFFSAVIDAVQWCLNDMESLVG